MLIRPKSVFKLIKKKFGNTSWLRWEPETLKIELAHGKDNYLGLYGNDPLFTNIVDAIRALNAHESTALTDWPILENVLTAFSGDVPDFYATTPPEPYEVLYGLKFIEDLGIDLDSNLTKETILYIGAIFVSQGILAHHYDVIDTCIQCVIAANNFESIFDADREKQIKLLNKVFTNKKAIDKLAAAILDGGASLTWPKNIDLDMKRALRILIATINVECIKRIPEKKLIVYLESLSTNHVTPIIIAEDSERANPNDEFIVNVTEGEADDYVTYMSNQNDASERPLEKDEKIIKTHPESLDVLDLFKDITGPSVKATKSASLSQLIDGLPEMEGFKGLGRLYKVTGEVGHDDVPKSTLNGTSGSGTTGGVTSGFYTTSPLLDVLDPKGKKIKLENTDNSPSTNASDSSIELSEI